MPTEIYFAGENVRVRVDEDPGQVAEAFTSAHGLPFRLTTPGGHREVYVNPSTVAFWHASEPGPGVERTPEPPVEPPQPTKGRKTVTDIWGRPLGRQPGR